MKGKNHVCALADARVPLLKPEGYDMIKETFHDLSHFYTSLDDQAHGTGCMHSKASSGEGPVPSLDVESQDLASLAHHASHSAAKGCSAPGRTPNTCAATWPSAPVRGKIRRGGVPSESRTPSFPDFKVLPRRQRTPLFVLRKMLGLPARSSASKDSYNRTAGLSC